MPPHCDSLDGPVVTAARQALASFDVDLVLPFVHAEGEAEVRNAFDLAVRARALGDAAQEVADRWFFETAVRVHRAAEGAPFTGLKPAGLDVGPVIPAAERALDVGSASELVDVLCASVREQVEQRHGNAMVLKEHAAEGRNRGASVCGCHARPAGVGTRRLSAGDRRPAPTPCCVGHN